MEVAIWATYSQVREHLGTYRDKDKAGRNPLGHENILDHMWMVLRYLGILSGMRLSMA